MIVSASSPTKAQVALLCELARSGEEIVFDTRSCEAYLGNRKVSVRVLNSLIRRMALKCDQGSLLEYYSLNDVGRGLLAARESA
jgi:hypothetical protein